MILDFQTIILFLILGTFVGFMSGLLGIGGGGFLVPAFVAIFSFNGISNDNLMHLALGTSMMSIVITSYVSFREHHKRGGVIWDIFKKMAIGVIIGTFLATFISSNISSYFLAIFFSVLMFIISIRMILDIKPKVEYKPYTSKTLFGAGMIIGAISAMMSVGGGAFTVPFLVSRGIEMKKAIGTSAAIGFPIAIFGTIGFMINGWESTSLSNYQIGNIYLPAVIFVSIATIFTVPFGVKMAHTIPTLMLKKIFAFLLIALSIKMVIKFL